jgi:hypothetical protein
MMDELLIEKLSVRSILEKMDEAFRAAMQRAINVGRKTPRPLSRKKPGTRNPKVVLA